MKYQEPYQLCPYKNSYEKEGKYKLLTLFLQMPLNENRCDNQVSVGSSCFLDDRKNAAHGVRIKEKKLNQHCHCELNKMHAVTHYD